MFLRFNLSKGINSVLLLFLWISIVITTLSASSNVTFNIEAKNSFICLIKTDSENGSGDELNRFDKSTATHGKRIFRRSHGGCIKAFRFNGNKRFHPY